MRDEAYRQIIATYKRLTAVLYIAQGVNEYGRIVGGQDSTSQPAQVLRVEQLALSASRNRTASNGWADLLILCQDFIKKYN